MSDPIDDKALDEYLKGGSLVSQRYRELGADEVPDDLDRRVLAQARAAVTKRSHQRSAWMRWSGPVALAASVVLVLAVVIDSGVQQQTIMVSEPKQPAPDPGERRERESASGYAADSSNASSSNESRQAAPAESPPLEDARAVGAQSKSTRRATERKKENAVATDRLQKSAPAGYAVNPQAPSSSPLAAMPAPESPTETVAVPGERPTATQQTAAASIAPPTPAVPSDLPAMPAARSDDAQLEEIILTGSSHRDVSKARGAGPRGTVPARNAGSVADVDEQDEQVVSRYSDPERWLEDIRRLRKDGEAAQADREWQRFRAAFPDYPVADADLARKK